MVFAIAHVRGGNEMGEAWHDDGMLLKKKNTFHDFIDSAEAQQAVGNVLRKLKVRSAGQVSELLEDRRAGGPQLTIASGD